VSEEAKLKMVEQAVLSAAQDQAGKLSLGCAEAHAIADEHEVSRREVGAIGIEHDIRIVACQLGLFK